MKREIITIDENGNVSIPGAADVPVLMQDFEVAELFEVMLPTVKSYIRAILKFGVVTTGVTNGATLVDCNIVPDYYGMEMIVTLAFRIQSPQAEIFRKWALAKITKKETCMIHQQVFISVDKSINGLTN